MISRSTSCSSSPVSRAASRIETVSSISPEEILEEAEREPALRGRPLDLGERVAAVAHPGDDPGGPDRRRSPLTVVLRDQAAVEPPAQGRRLHADGVAASVSVTGRQACQKGTASRRRGPGEDGAPSPAGVTARCVSRRRSSRFRRRLAIPLGGAITIRPIALLERLGLLGIGAKVNRAGTLRPLFAPAGGAHTSRCG